MDSTVTPNNIEVVQYRDEYRKDFERLNREWIEEFFTLEAPDREVFHDPRGKIIATGGQIFFVLEHGEPKGTCALVRESASTYELVKMGVAPSARGKGFGDLLMRAAIDFAVSAGAYEIVLSSNKKLHSALRLYEKHGFKPVPLVSDGRYQRVDIMMRLVLPKSN
jgi:GNAT superfamily N-acetyltransferase